MNYHHKYDELLDELLWLRAENKRLQNENFKLLNSNTNNINLMVQGEQLRDKMLLDAIINGAFDKR